MKTLSILEILGFSIILTGCGTDSRDLFGPGADFTEDGGIEADAAPQDPSVADDAGDPSDAQADAQADPGAGGTSSNGGRSAAGGRLATGGRAASGGASGGSPPVAEAGGAPQCAPVTHETGVGQTWVDCIPLSTYTATQAMRACQTWCAANVCQGSCWTAVACDTSVVLGQTEAGMTAWATGSGLVYQINGDTLSSCGVTGVWK